MHIFLDSTGAPAEPVTSPCSTSVPHFVSHNVPDLGTISAKVLRGPEAKRLEKCQNRANLNVMTANVQLTVEEIRDLQELTHRDDIESAVKSALDEYLRYARRMRLKEASGQVEMKDNWRSLEASETDGAHSH